MLKNLMEDKQLDFNQPFLSVRRFSSTVVSSEADERKKADKSIPKLPPLPVYKSELKSGPVSHPGAVPFLWEQTPGRPKDESNPQTKAPEQRLVAPRLPPGRVSNVKQQASDKGSKGTAATRSHNGNFLSSSQDVSNLDEKNATHYESPKEGTQYKGSSGSEDGDEAYLDALDTLSRSESSYMNCSVSGVSGLDGPNVKPSGIFSTDPQTRDFMMGRFLPAAKAMASETPQYGTRKRLIAREQSRQLKTAPSVERHTLNQYKPNAFPHHAQEICEEESEYGADDYDGSENISATVCGLFPRFCLKNSFCLLNPVPGMKMQAQLPVSSVCRMQTKSSCAGSRGETEKKYAGEPVHGQRSMNRQQAVVEFKCNSKQIVEKNDCQKLDGSSLYRRLQGSGLSPCQNGYSQASICEEKGFLGITENAKNHRANGYDMHRKGPKNFRELLTIENTEWELELGSPVVEKTVYVDSVHTEKSLNLNSSSLDMKRFTDFCGNDLEIPEKSSDMKENLSIDSSVQDIQHLIVVNEKTIIQPKSLESFNSCSMSFSDRSPHDIEIDMKNFSRHHQDLIQDYAALKNSKVADQENFDPERKQFGKLGGQENSRVLPEDSLSVVCLKAADDKETDIESEKAMELGDQEGLYALVKDPIPLESSRMTVDKKINPESPEPKKLYIEESSYALVQSSIAKLASDKKIDLENERNVKLSSQGNAHWSRLQKPLALPLPKSPSESWLKRTLPTISSRNTTYSSRSALGAHGSEVSMTSNLDPKWETIVKTSNVHHGHLRFSQDLLTPIPEA